VQLDRRNVGVGRDECPQGIGGAINAWSAQARFADVWSAVVLVTGVSLVLYMLVQVLETFVLSRMSLSLT